MKCRTKLGIIVLIVIAIAFAVALSARSNGKVASAITQGNIIGLVNNFRVQNNLPALAVNAQLNQSALAKAQDMCAKNYWAHGQWAGFVSGAGYNYITAGENLAYGFQTAEATLTGWVNSAGHYANIVNREYKETGVAVLSCQNYQKRASTIIVVNHFGARVNAPKPVTPKQPERKVCE